MTIYSTAITLSVLGSSVQRINPNHQLRKSKTVSLLKFDIAISNLNNYVFFFDVLQIFRAIQFQNLVRHFADDGLLRLVDQILFTDDGDAGELFHQTPDNALLGPAIGFGLRIVDSLLRKNKTNLNIAR